MTRESGFDERWDGGGWDSGYGAGYRGLDDDAHRERDAFDERVRELLIAAVPDFSVNPALADRVMAGAARRRAVARALAGAGAVAVIAVAALAVVPLAGFGVGHASRIADTRMAPGAFGMTSSAAGTATPSPSAVTAPSPTQTPTSSSPSSGDASDTALTALSQPTNQPTTQPTTQLIEPSWLTAPKEKAVERVEDALQYSHQNSYMGVGFSGQDYTNGGFDEEAVYDASPIVVYRKPHTDPSLEPIATQAAAPFKVVFRDTVLDASEQWFLGHRIEQDAGYWKNQGLEFRTALQNNGTITIMAPDPGVVVPLLEQYYGYDGQVFVGEAVAFHEAATAPY